MTAAGVNPSGAAAPVPADRLPAERRDLVAPAETRRPRICFVTATDVTVKAFLIDHLRALSRDHEVSVVTNTSDAGFLWRAGIDGEVIPVPIERKISLGRDLRALWALWRVFRAGGFDAVHSVTPKAGLLSMLAGALARVPLRVHTFTGQVWATREGLARAFLRGLDRLLAALATRLLADSRSQRDFLAAERVAAADRIVVLGSGSISGVDVERFRPDPAARADVRRELGIPEGAPMFLFLGRLNRDKGVLDLAAAFAEHARVAPGSHLVIVGRDEEELRPLIERDAGAAAARLRFVGFTFAPERYMAAADVLCLPSYREGFGSVIIEAAAAGVPSIASRIYGIVDAVDEGRTGLLHEPRDVQGLAAAMTRVATDEQLRARLAERGLSRARDEFSTERITNELLSFYEHALSAVSTRTGEAGPAATGEAPAP